MSWLQVRVCPTAATVSARSRECEMKQSMQYLRMHSSHSWPVQKSGYIARYGAVCSKDKSEKGGGKLLLHGASLFDRREKNRFTT